MGGRGWRRGLVLVASLGLGGVADAQDGAPSPTTDMARGRLAFSAEGDIYLINLDGTGRTRLTTDPAIDLDPIWSPDGTKIAFRSHRDGNEEVYVMDADGANQTNLSRNPASDYSPAWSPDGDTIAFASNRDDDPNEIYVMGADGRNPTWLTDHPGIDEYPSWSPDGTKIAFTCTGGPVLPGGTGDFEICVMNADGADLRQLTDAPGESKLPAWSPTGTAITFQSNRDGWPTVPDYVPPAYEPARFGDYEIYVMDPEGRGQINRTNHPEEDDEFPAWSPDGSHLVFSRYGCLVVMAADGANQEQLGSCSDGGQFPAWSPTPLAPTRGRGPLWTILGVSNL